MTSPPMERYLSYPITKNLESVVQRLGEGGGGKAQDIKHYPLIQKG